MGRDCVTYLLAMQDFAVWGALNCPVLSFGCFSRVLFWQTQMMFRKVVLALFSSNANVSMRSSLPIRIFWICIFSWFSVQLLFLLYSCKSFIWALLIHVLVQWGVFVCSSSGSRGVSGTAIQTVKCYSRCGDAGAGTGWLCSVVLQEEVLMLCSFGCCLVPKSWQIYWLVPTADPSSYY